MFTLLSKYTYKSRYSVEFFEEYWESDMCVYAIWFLPYYACFLLPQKFVDPAEHTFTFWGETFKIRHVVSKRHEALKESFQPAVAYLMCDARCPASAADDNCRVHGVLHWGCSISDAGLLSPWNGAVIVCDDSLKLACGKCCWPGEAGLSQSSGGDGFEMIWNTCCFGDPCAEA